LRRLGVLCIRDCLCVNGFSLKCGEVCAVHSPFKYSFVVLEEIVTRAGRSVMLSSLAPADVLAE
jgi:hypothetical protein